MTISFSLSGYASYVSSLRIMPARNFFSSSHNSFQSALIKTESFLICTNHQVFLKLFLKNCIFGFSSAEVCASIWTLLLYFCLFWLEIEDSLPPQDHPTSFDIRFVEFLFHGFSRKKCILNLEFTNILILLNLLILNLLTAISRLAILIPNGSQPRNGGNGGYLFRNSASCQHAWKCYSDIPEDEREREWDDGGGGARRGGIKTWIKESKVITLMIDK